MALPNKTELKELVAKGKTGDVIKGLLAASTAIRDNDLHNDVVSQSAKWETFRREQAAGVLSEQEERITKARLTEALLYLIDQLPDNLQQQEQNTAPTPAATTTSSPPVPPNSTNKPIEQPMSPGSYLAISGGALLLSILLFVGLAFFQDRLSGQLGDRAYYILLFPLAFSTAAFLFGAMRTYAAYTHSAVDQKLELGGPAVAALLVIVAGFQLVPKGGPFEYTIFLDGAGAKPGFNSEYPAVVKLKLNNDVRTDEADEHGAADFKNIDAGFQGKEVPVELDFNGWQFASTHSNKTTVKLSDKSASLAIEPDGSLSKVSGRVRDEENNRFLSGVAVSIGSTAVKTDELGYFQIDIPSDQQKREQLLSAYKEGYVIWEKRVYPETKEEIPILLTKAKK